MCFVREEAHPRATLRSGQAFPRAAPFRCGKRAIRGREAVEEGLGCSLASGLPGCEVGLGSLATRLACSTSVMA
jgi:hypothetical protein